MSPAIQQTCPFFQQHFEETNPKMPLLPAPDHLPTSLIVATFTTVFSATLCPGDQPTPHFELGSLLPPSQELPDRSDPFHRSCCPPPGPQASGPPALTSLWASCLPGGCGSDRATSSAGPPRRDPWPGPQQRLKVQTQQGAALSSRRRGSCSQTHGLTLWSMEATVILAKSLNQTFWILVARVLRPHTCR